MGDEIGQACEMPLVLGEGTSVCNKITDWSQEIILQNVKPEGHHLSGENEINQNHRTRMTWTWGCGFSFQG